MPDESIRTDSSCAYHSPGGDKCPNSSEHSEFCFWHDTETDKTGSDIMQRFERYVHDGGFTQGLSLKNANLQGINLVRPKSAIGYDLTGCDLYKADLRGAHLFALRLTSGSIMKADLREANINGCNFENSNLLGVRLSECKLDRIHLGTSLLQEQKARRSKSKAEADDLFQQAEEIYRSLRKASEEQGLFSLGGHLIHKELTMRRLTYPKFSSYRIQSKAIDLFCGYGEKPANVVVFSLIFIIVCAFLYFFLGIQFNGELLQFSASSSSVVEGIKQFFVALYFSVVTFTTLGYGDITPVGVSRVVAAIEAFAGAFTLALFVVVFVKKMTR